MGVGQDWLIDEIAEAFPAVTLPSRGVNVWDDDAESEDAGVTRRVAGRTWKELTLTEISALPACYLTPEGWAALIPAFMTEAVYRDERRFRIQEMQLLPLDTPCEKLAEKLDRLQKSIVCEFVAYAAEKGDPEAIIALPTWREISESASSEPIFSKEIKQSVERVFGKIEPASNPDYDIFRHISFIHGLPVDPAEMLAIAIRLMTHQAATDRFNFHFCFRYLFDNLYLGLECARHPGSLYDIEKITGREYMATIESLPPEQRSVLADWVAEVVKVYPDDCSVKWEDANEAVVAWICGET